MARIEGGSLALVPPQSLGVNTFRVVQDPNTGKLTVKAGGTYLDTEAIPSLGKFLLLDIDITNVGGAGTLTATIVGIDPVNLKQYSILASGALAAVATTQLRVGPGLTAGALVVNDFMPPAFGITLVVAGNAVIFGVAAEFMP